MPHLIGQGLICFNLVDRSPRWQNVPLGRWSYEYARIACIGGDGMSSSYYSHVVEDCPLKCIVSPPLDRVDEVSVQVIHSPYRPAAALLPDLPEALHRRRSRRSVLPEGASHPIDLVDRGQRRTRHPGEFPAEVLQLRFVQPIGVQGGHMGIVSCSPFVRLL